MRRNLSASSRLVPGEFERRCDDFEKRLKEKIEVQTGFADPETNARKMHLWFKFFDTDNTGQIDYKEFFAAMTKFNFVGVQREVEALFNRYDTDASGTLDYKEFSYHLYGLGDKPRLDVNSQNIVEKVKARMLESAGTLGYHGLSRLIGRLDHDGSKTVDREELEEGLRDYYGIDDITREEMDQLFAHFDKDLSGRIDAWEFLRGLKSGMSYERKQMVREVFRKLDIHNRGEIFIDDLLDIYDTSNHPDVLAKILTPAEAVEQMLSFFGKSRKSRGSIKWEEFLDYYRTMSLTIPDDEFFNSMLTNAWHLPGSSCGMRFLVVHSDGSTEYVSLEQDIGIDRLDGIAVSRALKKQGVKDIVDIRV